MLDVKEIRKDFPMLRNHPELIYFDNGATTYKPDCVIQAIVSFYENYTSNVARGEYATAVMADKAYAKARKTIAEFIHAEEKEIVFTANVTASLNQVAYGMRKWLNEGDVILTTKAEHASNLLPFYRLQKDLGIKINYIPVDAFGKIHIDDFKRMLNDKVKLVSIAEVSNVIGVTQEVKELIQLAHQVNALVCIDAAQSIGHMPIDVKDLDVDFLCYSSHKMCGPDGVGVLYGKKRLLEEMEPLMLGGGMNARFSSNGDMIYKNAPEKFEAGTPNIEGVIGLEKATEYLMQIGMDNIHEYERELRTYLLNKMKEIDTLVFYNDGIDSANVTFNVKDVFAQDAAGYLASKNIAVRSGNHCAKILHEVIGTDQSLRASLYFYNTKEEVDYFVEVVKEVNLENAIGIFF